MIYNNNYNDDDDSKTYLEAVLMLFDYPIFENTAIAL